jgi:hypothetical protein
MSGGEINWGAIKELFLSWEDLDPQTAETIADIMAGEYEDPRLEDSSSYRQGLRSIFTDLQGIDAISRVGVDQIRLQREEFDQEELSEEERTQLQDLLDQAHGVLVTDSEGNSGYYANKPGSGEGFEIMEDSYGLYIQGRGYADSPADNNLFILSIQE